MEVVPSLASVLAGGGGLLAALLLLTGGTPTPTPVPTVPLASDCGITVETPESQRHWGAASVIPAREGSCQVVSVEVTPAAGYCFTGESLSPQNPFPTTCTDKTKWTVVRWGDMTFYVYFVAKEETAVPYNLNTTTAAAITTAGSYSFLLDVDDPSSVLGGHPSGMGKEKNYGLLVHASDADGTSRENLYNGVAPGDRFDVVRGDDCFFRYAVTEVRRDLAGSVPVKVFAVDAIGNERSHCGYYKVDAPVTFRWHVQPGVAGDDGIRVLMQLEPVPGPGRYRLVDYSDIVITIPVGMTLTLDSAGIGSAVHSAASREGAALLVDEESGSTISLNLTDGTEIKRVIKTLTPEGGGGAAGLSSSQRSTTRDVGALFDQIVASVEMVP